MKTPRFIILVSAPNVPVAELKSLKANWKWAKKNIPDFTLVTNYEVEVQYLPIDRQYLVSAPDVPPGEVLKLRKKFDRRRRHHANKPIFVNFEVQVCEI